MSEGARNDWSQPSARLVLQCVCNPSREDVLYLNDVGADAMAPEMFDHSRHQNGEVQQRRRLD